MLYILMFLSVNPLWANKDKKIKLEKTSDA